MNSLFLIHISESTAKCIASLKQAHEDEQEESESTETAYNKTLDPESQETDQDDDYRPSIEHKEEEERLRKEQEAAREKLMSKVRC